MRVNPVRRRYTNITLNIITVYIGNQSMYCIYTCQSCLIRKLEITVFPCHFNFGHVNMSYSIDLAPEQVISTGYNDKCCICYKLLHLLYLIHHNDHLVSLYVSPSCRTSTSDNVKLTNLKCTGNIFTLSLRGSILPLGRRIGDITAHRDKTAENTEIL